MGLRFLSDLGGLYAHIVLLFGVYVLVLSLSNILYLMFATRPPFLTEGPLVSVLIPARNEQDNIGECLESLAGQSYRNYEIIVLDDHSDDNTGAVLEYYRKSLPELRIIRGRPIPEGWNGKPFAMHQLAAEARGEYLLFVDADTRHGPDSISWAVTNAERHGFDLLSGYPGHTNRTFGEKLVVPNMYLNTALFLPLWGLRYIPFPVFSMALGQFMMFRSSSYARSGGYETVKNKITEDVYISRELKRQGYSIGMLDARRQVSCRMYSGFSSAVNGIGKNIFDFFEEKLPPVVFLIFFFVLFMIIPPFWAVYLGLEASELFHLVLPGVLFFTLGWGSFLHNRGQDWFLPLLYPLMFSIIIVVAVKSIMDFKTGKGYRWKGRILTETRS